MGESVDLSNLYPDFGEYQGWDSWGGVNPPSGYGRGGTNFWDVFAGGLKSASGVLGTRYSVPQLNPGQLITTGPQGTTMYQGNQNSVYAGIPSLSSFGGGSMGMLPLLLIGGVVLFAVMKK